MIARILSKASPKILSTDALGLALLLTALQAFAQGISASLGSTGARQSMYFFGICVIAILIAHGLSSLKLNGIHGAVVMVAIGIAGVWILGARLGSPLLDLGGAILDLVPQIIPALRFGMPVDTSGVANTWRVIAETSAALSVRVQGWLGSLSRNVTVNDALVRDMAWTLIMWLLAAWMGWFAGRRNAVVSLLPPILLLAAVISYSGVRIYTLWMMVSVLLLLMGLWNYKQHTALWETRKVDYSDSIRYDVGQAVIFLTIIIGAITFVTPSISWREIRDYLRERNQASENEAADLLGLRQRQAAGPNISPQKPSLPRDHLLSGGSAFSEDVVMTISTGELPPIASPSVAASAPRYYWRSTTYDIYVGAGWMTSTTAPQRYQPNTPLIPGVLSRQKALHLDVELVQPEGRLFWSGVLFSTDASIRADWRIRPRLDLFADQAALLQTDMFAAATSARTYKAESYVPRVTAAELRAASTNYPEEILKRYVQLPSSVPTRVHALAQEITAGKTNAYDKAKAIEAYLRSYPYDLEVPGPPEGQDVADYFLFDLKKGYCDYYATAMVVLARASGLPARFVSGYASGSYDAVTAEYVVRERDAHSWAEVFFPEIGWVEFEPTAAQPEVELASSSGNAASASPVDSTASQLLNHFRLERAITWLSPVALTLLAALLYFTLIERWLYLRRLAPSAAIEKLYRRLYRLGRPLAGEHTRAETAYEYMQKLITGIDAMPIKEHSRFARFISTARHDVELMTDLYQAALFGHTSMQRNEARKALNTWKRLRLRLSLARVTFLLHNKVKPSSSQ